jgi:signal transduction histidine kinase
MLAAATALLAVLLLAVPLGLLAAHGYVKDERLEVEQAAVTAAASTQGDPTSRPTVRIDGGEIQLSVFDARGRFRSGPTSGVSSALVRSALTGREVSTTGSDAIAVATPITDGDTVTGAVLLTTSLAAAHQRAVHAWLLLAGMCVAAVALSAGAARWIATRLAAPVSRLSETALSIGDGDLSARAAMSGVAELDMLADALNHTAEEIQSMLGRERGFSAEVSHQLRTPLSGLRLELDLVQRLLARPSDSGHHEDVVAGIDRARSDVDRLAATITEVISLARDLPREEHVALAKVLAEVERRWHGVLASSSRPLHLCVPSEVEPDIPISPAAASQILDVLLDNATTHGCGAVSVRVTCDDGVVRIDVANEGPPLPAEPWTLFRPRAAGIPHGLGLPYARRLAEAEGARLVVASSDPPTFSLVMSPRLPTSEAETGQGRRVLFASDRTAGGHCDL